jgi:hypothetical protein
MTATTAMTIQTTLLLSTSTPPVGRVGHEMTNPLIRRVPFCGGT